MTDEKKIMIPIFKDDFYYKNLQKDWCTRVLDCHPAACLRCLFDTRNTKEFSERFERLHD